MAEFNWNGLSIHYEDYGRGEPLLIFNGIFMSCASWKEFVPAFSQNNRLLLLDFVDQGLSGKMKEEYTQDTQVEVALALLQVLGLGAVNLAGISYGGEVAIKLASRYPQKVRRLVLSNTAARTSCWLRDIGRAWEYAYKSYDGHQFFKTCIPVIYSPQFYEKNYEWACAREEFFARVFTPEVYEAFGRLTRSAEQHDERANLSRISAKTLIISSEYDFVTPLYQQKELAEGIPGAGHVTIQGAGHAVMYEKPAEFAAQVLGFVNSDLQITTVS